MLPDWVSSPGPLLYESGALPFALCGLVAMGCDIIASDSIGVKLVIAEMPT